MFPRRRQNPEHDLLHTLHRNVLLEVRRGGATHALVCRTNLSLTVHFGMADGNGFCLLWTERYPAVVDSYGWNLMALQDFLGEGDMSTTRLNLRGIPRDEQGRIALIESAGNDTSRHLNGNDTYRQIPRFKADIKREIYIAVMDAGDPVTRAGIAKAVGRKKTPWLNEQIEQLVSDGLLTRSNGAWKNGCLMYVYDLAD